MGAASGDAGLESLHPEGCQKRPPEAEPRLLARGDCLCGAAPVCRKHAAGNHPKSQPLWYTVSDAF
ncbi:hypothetical protein CLDAP_09510 [Caldilinea aerophila DSM 14535 = NBRC 104270]|uniref:Uncharacterized protein n=1 Tax=Caldilinea aerophila (strain DSM 14535 / JCM 11387 / NBRC 104270 / STL-6-O1) TaxID=926550 RepID=I0I153_CALAS|nr:hypothetical protein CLDAP_09510 [Caldilinea aerophila DSM 14535 = NBRC 104270]